MTRCGLMMKHHVDHKMSSNDTLPPCHQMTLCGLRDETACRPQNVTRKTTRHNYVVNEDEKGGRDGSIEGKSFLTLFQIVVMTALF